MSCNIELYKKNKGIVKQKLPDALMLFIKSFRYIS